MKVVLFCGGMGMRLKEFSDNIPKPLVQIGYRPILWHVMKYYAHHGHTDFILCLGYRGDAVKRYFLTYEETLSNDFVLSRGGEQLQLLGSDIQDWRIAFLDTGLNANIGQRLKAVQKQLEGEDVFLANYTDGLTDLPLPDLIADFQSNQAVASFVAVRPRHSFHVVSSSPDGLVTNIRHLGQSGIRINGGFFVFRREVFDFVRDGEDLVEGPFQRLLAQKRLRNYEYDGFWLSMDTFKDKQMLDDMAARGETPWEVWKT